MSQHTVILLPGRRLGTPGSSSWNFFLSILLAISFQTPRLPCCTAHGLLQPLLPPLSALWAPGGMECRTFTVQNEGRCWLCASAWPKIMYVFGGGGLVAKSYPTLATLWTPKLLCPWDSPGKNTGVGCQFFFQINVCFYLFLFILLVNKSLPHKSRGPCVCVFLWLWVTRWLEVGILLKWEE